ncbi:outer membrane beta-barrel protein [Rhizobium leguminosarum]|uniref:outer membrane protein n=1 Tax=Rhizobium leguminosarum TaxID=384 RepID=UPI0013CA7506|nr:outer membrane protein [Rhizobium leguminosarum]MBY5325477.1 porin family protein [Rhizobium leguminosarum]NEI96220.1 outer membrane beta-barrel protein [Rhizobium leguminosarum]NEJ82040.1 outer membrane beta-barrel protein [Rhizobium leguminosarum]
MFFPKRSTVVAGGLTLLACGASAADYNRYETPPTFSWAGAYAGVHGNVPRNFKALNSDDYLGFGAQLGYNFQVESSVLGLELEGSYKGNKASVPSGEVESRFSGAAKVRLGVDYDRTLLYATSGVTLTQFVGLSGVSVPDNWKRGYLFGGGVEHAFSGGVSAKIEYNYVMNGSVQTTAGITSSTSDLNNHVITAGLNLRF